MKFKYCILGVHKFFGSHFTNPSAKLPAEDKSKGIITFSHFPFSLPRFMTFESNAT